VKFKLYIEGVLVFPRARGIMQQLTFNLLLLLVFLYCGLSWTHKTIEGINMKKFNGSLLATAKTLNPNHEGN
jgi:hypothetical protein